MSKQSQIRALEERIGILERALRALAETKDDNMAVVAKVIDSLEARIRELEQPKEPTLWTP